jgi:hypothetical protein
MVRLNIGKLAWAARVHEMETEMETVVARLSTGNFVWAGTTART